MRNNIFILGGIATLLSIGGLVYFSIPRPPLVQKPTNDQSIILPPQKDVPKVSTTEIVPGNEVTIIGTVMTNVTEQAALDGAAYLTVNTVDGIDIRVTYFPGEAPCQNNEASKIGFSRVVGNPIEVYGKALSEKEILTCDSSAYYIKPLVAAQR